MSRKIILLSDGTGNSSAKIWRTNVWRICRGARPSGSDQVAIYDDGVGTSPFVLWAILGGAFGIGLKRNVIDIYKFASRNYRDVGDEIFGFGFSRGAFTIRTVIGLILDQGLINSKGISDSELDKLAHRAYRSFRQTHFHTNWGLAFRGTSHRSSRRLFCDTYADHGRSSRPSRGADAPAIVDELQHYRKTGALEE